MNPECTESVAPVDTVHCLSSSWPATCPVNQTLRQIYTNYLSEIMLQCFQPLTDSIYRCQLDSGWCLLSDGLQYETKSPLPPKYNTHYSLTRLLAQLMKTLVFGHHLLPLWHFCDTTVQITNYLSELAEKLK